MPPQHTLSAPHSAFVVHATQTWFTLHSWPPTGQSELAQQAPGVQVPLQQRSPEPHWASAEHCWQA